MIPSWSRAAQFQHEVCDRRAYLIWAVLLYEMKSLYGDFRLVWQIMAEFTLSALVKRAWLCVDVQLRKSAIRNPSGILSDYLRNIRRLPLDWQLTWRGKRWPPVLTWIEIR